jgi:hypothetical protein
MISRSATVILPGVRCSYCDTLKKQVLGKCSTERNRIRRQTATMLLPALIVGTSGGEGISAPSTQPVPPRNAQRIAALLQCPAVR